MFRNLFLFPFALLFGFAVRLKNICYNRGWLKSRKAAAAVVSIGNLSVGGTGKTPVTIALAQLFLKNGIKPGIVSRGYKRKGKGTKIATNGEFVFLDVECAGDEPFEMAQRLKNVPIVVSSKRIDGCKILTEKFHVDVILADDAFQHRKLHRDIDIVLLDSSISTKKLRVLPIGFLREPWISLRRADIFLWTKNMAKNVDFPALPQEIPQFSISELAENLFHNPITDKQITPEQIHSATVFCGIGNPNPFLQQMKKLLAENIKTVAFRDHAKYSIEKLSRLPKSKFYLTTEKDFWKLPKNWQQKENLFACRLQIQFPDQFEKLLFGLLNFNQNKHSDKR